MKIMEPRAFIIVMEEGEAPIINKQFCKVFSVEKSIKIFADFSIIF